MYAYNGTPVYPDNNFGSSNYFADVLFEPSDVTGPQVSSVTPVNNSIGIPLNVHPAATFNEALDPATITTSTVILTGPGNTVIPGTVTLTGGGTIVTFIPNADLAIGTLYTVTLKGGITEPLIKDISGNAMVNDYTWSLQPGD